MSTRRARSPKLGRRLLWGTLPTADIEAKLRRLTPVNCNNHNWSWLLDLKRPLETPVIPKVLALSMIQPASEPEEPAREGILPTVDLGKSRVSGRIIPTKGRGLVLSLHVPRALW